MKSRTAGQAGAGLQLDDLELAHGLSLYSLKILLRASQYAGNAGRSQWEFAIALDELKEAGFSECDLKWLWCKGYISHAAAETSHRAKARQSSDLPPREFAPDSVFILTPLGIPLAKTLLQEESLRNSRACAKLAEKEAGAFRGGPTPTWDDERRELRFGKILVKRYRVPAENQEIVLAAFQEETWPTHIDDPLPPVSHIDPKRRLHSTIQCLNRNRLAEILHFRGDGRGRGVCWDLLSTRGV